MSPPRPQGSHPRRHAIPPGCGGLGVPFPACSPHPKWRGRAAPGLILPSSTGPVRATWLMSLCRDSVRLGASRSQGNPKSCPCAEGASGEQPKPPTQLLLAPELPKGVPRAGAEPSSWTKRPSVRLSVRPRAVRASAPSPHLAAAPQEARGGRPELLQDAPGVAKAFAPLRLQGKGAQPGPSLSQGGGGDCRGYLLFFGGGRG